MHPILIHIGPVPIRAYGLMIVVGFLMSIWLAIRRGRKENLDKEVIIDLCFYLLIAALVGSKLLHVLVFWKDYLADIPILLRHPLELLTYLGSGLIFFGGLIVAIPTGIIFVKRRNIRLWVMADVVAPAIPLAHGFGRIGCFMAGCCYGKQCDAPWAITFSNPDSLAPLGVSLHPTQLYSSLWNFSLVVFLLFMGPRLKKYGQLFWTYILLYPIGRFIIEFFRDDQRGVLLNGNLSTSQFISIILVLTAIGALLIIHLKVHLSSPG